MNTNKTVLVLGATGGIGGEVARQLRDGGWNVRGLKRGLQAATIRDGITWIPGDAMNREEVMAAAQGCSVVVHAVNPPGYRRWSELVLPMLDNTIAAAIAQGATIVLPGTVYNFGPDAFPELGEDSPQHPLTRKGAIRVELERRLRAATTNGARAIVVRAGDFFGSKPGNNWFSQGLIKPGKPVAGVSLPGQTGVGHQWSYLPDVARTMVELLARRESLEPFAAFHMAGHWDADGTQMAEAIRRVVIRRGGAAPKLRKFPWWLIALASSFVTTFREMREMRYLWRQPLRMRNDKLKSVLGEEPHTPLDQAVESSLDGLGCLAPMERTTAASPATVFLAIAAAFAFGTLALPGHAQTPQITGIDSSAPVVSRNGIFIAAPIDVVWKVQTDISSWPEWRPTVPAARFDGELKVGSAFKWEEGGLKITSTVRQLDPMHRIVWTGPAQGIDAVHVWEFTETNGGVQVQTEESWSGDVVRANVSSLQPVLDRALQDWLTRLKSTSEKKAQESRR